MSKSGSKRRICIIVNHENTILLFRKNLVRALVERHHDVYILIPSFCDISALKELGASIVVYELKQHGTNIIEETRSIKSISKQLESINPDIVLTFTIKPNLYGGFLCRAKKIPYIATITGMGRGFEQSDLIKIVLASALSFSLKKAKRVVFQNRSIEAFFSPKYVSKKQSILVNGSGVDLAANPLEEYPNNQYPQLLFVGRITTDKGIRELLQAITEINSEKERVKLTLVGPVERDCEEVVSSVSHNDYFEFVGMKDHDAVHEYTKTCDVVVVPSYHEGMCNSLLEAAATGRPVITTNIPGCQETFEEMKSGVGCAPRDAAALKEAILKFIQLDYKQRQQMGLYGRKKMEKEFDRSVIVQQYVDLIEE